MTLRPEFALGHSEFNEFLFAAVGEEKNGMQLTVLSALSRLGFDAWAEAARLAALPEEAAARALAAAIAMLPEGTWKIADARTIATRLVHCLPSRSATAARPSKSGTVSGKAPKAEAARMLIYAAVAAAMLLVMWHLQSSHLTSPTPPAHTSSQP